MRSILQGVIDRPFDVVQLTCKAYDLESALDAIAPAVSRESAVLPLLNGIRHIDALKQRFGAPSVLGGITAINAALLPDGAIQQSQLRINMNHLGELDGKPSGRCAAIAAALSAGGLPAQAVETIAASLWQKFFGFACNATIATLTRSPAGSVAKAAAGARFVSAVTGEVAGIVAGEGYPIPPSFAALIQNVFSQPDSPYRPSSLVDMQAGKPTEGEHTIGDLVDWADRLGPPRPFLKAARRPTPCRSVTQSFHGL